MGRLKNPVDLDTHGIVRTLAWRVGPFATADGRVHFVTAGKSYVIKAGPRLEVLAANDLRGEMDGSSPAVSGGRIFIRGRKLLYCIGRK